MNIPLDKNYYLIRFEVNRDGYGDFDSVDILAGKIKSARLNGFITEFDLVDVFGYGYYETTKPSKEGVIINDHTFISDDIENLFNEVYSSNDGYYFYDWMKKEITERLINN